MDIIYIVFGIIIGWVVGRMHMIYQLRNVIGFLKNHHMISFIDEEEEESNPTPYYRVETHGSNLYLFDKKDVFICQAKSIEDLAKSFYNSLLIKKALIKHNEEIIFFKEGQITRIEHESKHR